MIIRLAAAAALVFAGTIGTATNSFAVSDASMSGHPMSSSDTMATGAMSSSHDKMPARHKKKHHTAAAGSMSTTTAPMAAHDSMTTNAMSSGH